MKQHRKQRRPHLFAAIRTRAGRSAVASIQIGGAATLADLTPATQNATAMTTVHQFIDRHFCSASGTKAAEMQEDRVYFGTWGRRGDSGEELPTEAGEELVIARHSHGLFEVHCHGGKMAAARITNDVKSAGGVLMTAEELLLEQATDLLAAEAEIAVAQAATDLTAAHLLAQSRGALHRRIADAQSLLEQDQFGELTTVLDDLLSYAELGVHLLTPFQVVIVGPPNVGKSSLINKLLGFDRSIVFDQPGTTRDVLKTTTGWDGWLFELSDTAGVREQAANEIEQAGIDRAIHSIDGADLLVVVADATADGDNRLRPRSTKPTLWVTNKCDLLESETNVVPEGHLAVSAKTGEGVPGLVREIVNAVTRQVAVGEPLPFLVRHRQLLESARSSLDRRQPDECRRNLAMILFGDHQNEEKAP